MLRWDHQGIFMLSHLHPHRHQRKHTSPRSTAGVGWGQANETVTAERAVLKRNTWSRWTRVSERLGGKTMLDNGMRTKRKQPRWLCPRLGHFTPWKCDPCFYPLPCCHGKISATSVSRMFVASLLCFCSWFHCFQAAFKLTWKEIARWEG